MHQLEF